MTDKLMKRDTQKGDGAVEIAALVQLQLVPGLSTKWWATDGVLCSIFNYSGYLPPKRHGVSSETIEIQYFPFSVFPKS